MLGALSGFLALALPAQEAAPSRPAQTETAVPIRIETSTAHSYSLSSGQDRITLPDSFREDGKAIAFKNISISGTPTSEALVFHSVQSDVMLTVEGFAGWSARLSKGAGVSVAVNTPQAMLDVNAPVENAIPLSLTFPDGGSATVSPGSRVRFDLLKDQTYLVTASGKVLGINADGQKFVLSQNTLPMEGGPLVEVSDATGKHLQRLRPLVDVKIPRRLEGLLKDEVIDHAIALAGTGSKTLSLANGATVQLEQAGQNLTWKVLKGYIQFSINEGSGWKAAGLTGNAGRMLWDDSGKEIDLKNLGEMDSLLVSLPNATIVRISPKATFQFAFINSLSFATSASGGAVTLFNSNTQLEYPVDEGNLLFKSGIAVNNQHASAQASHVNLTWNSSGVNVSGSGVNDAVAPKSEKVVGGTGSGMLQVNYSEASEVIVRALNQSFSLTVDAFQNGSINLAEGDAVAFHFDKQRGVLSVKAFPGNSFPIEFDAGNGRLAQLAANQQATVVSTLGTLSGGSGSVIFFEGAGSGGSGGTFGLAPAATSLPTPFSSFSSRSGSHVDVSRISQPPASVVR